MYRRSSVSPRSRSALKPESGACKLRTCNSWLSQRQLKGRPVMLVLLLDQRVRRIDEKVFVKGIFGGLFLRIMNETNLTFFEERAQFLLTARCYSLHSLIVGSEMVQVTPRLKLRGGCFTAICQRIGSLNYAENVRIDSLDDFGQQLTTPALLTIVSTAFVRFLRGAVSKRQGVHHIC